MSLIKEYAQNIIYQDTHNTAAITDHALVIEHSTSDGKEILDEIILDLVDIPRILKACSKTLGSNSNQRYILYGDDNNSTNIAYNSFSEEVFIQQADEETIILDWEVFKSILEKCINVTGSM